MQKRTRPRRSRLIFSAFGIALCIGAVGNPVLGDEYGQKFYRQYCSACHGESGKGDGVVSQLMQPKPPDLTQLSKKAGGKFPFYDVIRVVDGRETVRAHGDSGMPVWGDLFRAEEASSAEAQAIARGKVVLIADYLESIQAK